MCGRQASIPPLSYSLPKVLTFKKKIIPLSLPTQAALADHSPEPSSSSIWGARSLLSHLLKFQVTHTGLLNQSTQRRKHSRPPLLFPPVSSNLPYDSVCSLPAQTIFTSTIQIHMQIYSTRAISGYQLTTSPSFLCLWREEPRIEPRLLCSRQALDHGAISFSNASSRNNFQAHTHTHTHQSTYLLKVIYGHIPVGWSEGSKPH